MKGVDAGGTGKVSAMSTWCCDSAAKVTPQIKLQARDKKMDKDGSGGEVRSLAGRSGQAAAGGSQLGCHSY